MEARLMLCDAAQVVEGKLYIIGGGWDNCNPTVPHMSVVVEIMVDWGLTNQKHSLELLLVDQDHNRIGPRPDEPPIEIKGDFTVGRPASLPSGSSVPVKQSISLINLQLEPNKVYSWVLLVDGSEIATAVFTTRV